MYYVLVYKKLHFVMFEPILRLTKMIKMSYDLKISLCSQCKRRKMKTFSKHNLVLMIWEVGSGIILRKMQTAPHVYVGCLSNIPCIAGLFKKERK